MMPVEQGWGKEQVLHRQCGIPCYGIGLFLGKKIMEKKICLSLLILCLVSESGCISFALCNHSQSKHGMKLFFDQTQYFYFNVLLFEVFLLNSYRFTQPQLTLLGGKGEESLIEITKNIYLVNSRKQKSHRKVPARGQKCVDGF